MTPETIIPRKIVGWIDNRRNTKEGIHSHDMYRTTGIILIDWIRRQPIKLTTNLPARVMEWSLVITMCTMNLNKNPIIPGEEAPKLLATAIIRNLRSMKPQAGQRLNIGWMALCQTCKTFLEIILRLKLKDMWV